MNRTHRHAAKSVSLSSMTRVDPRYCPVCGTPNRCGVAEGRISCWCFDKTLTEGLSDRIADEARNVACVCEACATGGKVTAVATDPG
jgi:Cysteine-rich CWC